MHSSGPVVAAAQVVAEMRPVSGHDSLAAVALRVDLTFCGRPASRFGPNSEHGYPDRGEEFGVESSSNTGGGNAGSAAGGRFGRGQHHLTDGSRHSSRIGHRIGSATRPMSGAESEAKFAAVAVWLLGQQRAETLMWQCWDLATG